MDFVDIGNKLVKEYPWLEGYVNTTKVSLRFSVQVNSFVDSALCPLMVGIRNTKLSISSCLDVSGNVFPPGWWHSGDLANPTVDWNKLDWEWDFSQRGWDDAYSKIVTYLPALKSAIDWFNSIPFDSIDNTLLSLGFERKNILRYWLIERDIIIDIILPTVLTPCFRLIVKREGIPGQKWFRVFADTFDEMLNKFISMKGE